MHGTAEMGAAWGEKCTADVDFINLLGMYVKGRAAVAAIHEKIFQGPYKASTLKCAVEHVRAFSNDAVLAIVPAELQIPQGAVEGFVRTVATIVFVRNGDEWLVAHFHNTKREATQTDHTAIMTRVFEAGEERV
jgi:uncharacterized protein (TIGR02246 family)